MYGNEEALYSTLLPSLGRRDPAQWDSRFASLAWRLHPKAAIDAFTTRATSPRLSGEARKQAVVALGFINDPRAAQAMADLTRSTIRDVAAQAAWWMTYRKTNDWRAYPVDGWIADLPDVTPASLEEMLTRRVLVLDGAAPVDRRIDAALAMARDPNGGLLLIQLAAENKVAYQLKEAIGSVIFSNPDRSVRTAAAGLFQRPGGAPRMTVADVTALTGDATRGQARFAGSCSTCHRVAGVGADVGPDLTDISKKFDRAGVVEAIVNPSAAVAFGFGAEVFVTRRNEAHIGFLQADGPTVSFRDGYGRVRTFAREELAARVPLKTSLMPDPLALALSEQDVADIGAFLMKR